jgi:DNA-binding Xre family transcriptional regulator
MKKTRHDSPFMDFLEQKGKKPEQLAEAIGVSARAVYYWTAGQREPRLTVKQMQDLCRFLNCSIHELPSEFGPIKESAEA